MQTRFGKYRLLERLAAGGMAEIWLAWPEGPGAEAGPVVLKRILPHLAEQPAFVHRLLAEARVATLLSHANVARILEFGCVAGRWFIAMEHVPGEDLDALGARLEATDGAMGWQDAAAVMVQVSLALHHAHACSDATGHPLHMLHRDVTPSNVRISYDGHVKVLDFGIAAAQGLAGAPLVGKWAYLSPEQCLGEPVDARSDVFSSGTVLWELVTGTRLFKHASALLTVKRVAELRPPPARTLRPELPAALDRILATALARRPADRFPTSLALAAALEDLLSKAGERPDLGALMRATFPERIRAWAAQESGLWATHGPELRRSA